MTKVAIALDWTPNTNHAGFYLAKAQGRYQAAGLDVTIISPHVDAYKTTPASRVADGIAMFAVTPSESVISYNTWGPEGAAPEGGGGSGDGGKPAIRAVAALLQSSTSAIVTLASSGIDRPAKLDGKVYASYGARYEGRIVQQLIRNDGGKGEFTESTPPMLDIWDMVVQGKADATWVFCGWEGILAKRRGVALHEFGLEQYSVPYGYSPVLVAHPDTLREQADAVKAFLAATAEAFEWAAAHPKEAAAAFVKEVEAEHAAQPLPEPLDAGVVEDSMAFLAPHFLAAGGHWGRMDASRWEAFLDWLAANALLTRRVQSRTPQEGLSTTLDGLRAGDVGEPVPRDQVQAATLFTNEFLPAQA